MKFYRGLWAVTLCLGLSATSSAYITPDRWMSTATNGPVGPLGTPITLTWSIVPDGTVIPDVFPGVDRTSNLISAFDSLIGSGGGSDLTQRPWFQPIAQAFARWSAVSGVTFIYQEADDGAEHGTFPGVLPPNAGARGDIRLGGAFIDGTVGNNLGTLAYTIFPDNADLVLDTGDSSYYGNSSSNYLRMRNTVSHEIGHSLGLGHIDAQDPVAFLMEPFIPNPPNTWMFDGPQLDDILGVQRLYGDANEKTNGGAGNNSASNATPLGAIAPGQTISVGTHAATGLSVLPTETDFASIANVNDVDFFSFTTSVPAMVDITLTPQVNAPFQQRFDSSQPYLTQNFVDDNNLNLQLYAIDGANAVLLATSAINPAGQAESILDFVLSQPGTYAARVAGSGSLVQLYQLDIGVEALPIDELEGDYNRDGTVDAADYVLWRNLETAEGPDLSADGNDDGRVDDEDLASWTAHFGESNESGGGSSVPEPSSLGLFLILACAGATARRKGGEIAAIFPA